ncbi:hypothetical protein Y1Q_0012484 [Alligator mississippiensis]|uniref:Uncharacterized protein n=1 Tax=Alligator mississippiensis TaxID=8496 RepID=A0A151M7T5_ALLMI|nr:hypothetical protein Y1Q_0012484 [Alligator mississippiensis]
MSCSCASFRAIDLSCAETQFFPQKVRQSNRCASLKCWRKYKSPSKENTKIQELEEQKPPHRLLDLSICSTLNRSMFPDPTDIYVSIKSFIQIAIIMARPAHFEATHPVVWPFKIFL